MSSLLGGGGGGLAGLSRVAFEATGVGETTRDIERVESVYRSSVGEMSDSALKLQLAEERLQRTLRKGPGAAQSQANAELALRRAERELRGETDATTRALDRQQREMSQTVRGTIAGSGALRGLGRNLAFASAGFLGGAGLIYGMRQAISVASNLEEQINATRVVFKESADTVLDWSKTTSTTIGIAQDQALQYAGSIGGIANASGLARDESAALSKSIVQLAADLASAKNEDPSEMLEALRSGLVGEAEPLRRRGVLLSAAAVSQEAFRLGLAKTAAELTEGDKVQARYSIILKQTADIQGDYARTSDSLANSQRTLSALWREAQGIVGQALAPAFTDAVQGIRDWLSVEENQVQMQKTVNALVGDAEKIVRGFAGGLKIAKDAASPLVDAMGGIENAVRAATVLWIAFKAKAILGFAGTALASRRTATGMVADAAVAGRAWDFATRPRVMSVTTVGGGAFGPGGRGAPRTGGGGRFPWWTAAVGGLATRGAAATAVAVVASAGGGTQRGDRSKQYPRVYAAVARAAAGRASPAELAILRQEIGQYSLANAPDARMAAAERQLRDNAARERDPVGTSGDRDRPGMGRAVPDAAGSGGGEDAAAAGGGGGRTRRTLADIMLDQARASSTAGTGDDLRFHREARDLIQRQINNLERRKNLTAKQKTELARLYGELASEQSAIESIIDEGEAKIQEKKDAAAAKRKAAAEKRAAMQEQGEKELAALNANTAKRAADSRKRVQAILEAQGKSIAAEKKKKGDEKGLTAAEVHAMQFGFLQTLTGEIAQWGSNFMPDGGGSGQLETNSHVQTQLMQQQNAALYRLIEGGWHPGAQLASADLSAAGWGVGF